MPNQGYFKLSNRTRFNTIKKINPAYTKIECFFHKEYTLTECIIHKALLEEFAKQKQAGGKNLAIRRKKIVRLDHKWVWDSPIEFSGKMSM